MVIKEKNEGNEVTVSLYVCLSWRYVDISQRVLVYQPGTPRPSVIYPHISAVFSDFAAPL